MNLSSFFSWCRNQSAELKANITIMIGAMRHPATPWYARVFVALLVAYVISPIDLIPDFIPIFGYLDDLILILLGMIIAGKMIPADVWIECRMHSSTEPIPHSLYVLGISIVICGWIGTAYFLYRWLFL